VNLLSRLEVAVSGVTFKNPIIFGSAGWASNVPGIKDLIKAGFAGVVTKSTTAKPMVGGPLPRVFFYDDHFAASRQRTWELLEGLIRRR